MCNQVQIPMRCRYLSPSYASLSGYLIAGIEAYPSCINHLNALLLPLTAAIDTFASIGNFVNFDRRSKQAKRDHLKNLIAGISVFVQTPFILLGVTPHADRLTLFCNPDDPTLFTQIRNLDEKGQFLFHQELLANPHLRDRLIKVECSPHSPVVIAIKANKPILANWLMKDHGGHRHEASPGGRCYVWQAYCKKPPHKTDDMRELLGDVLVRNYFRNKLRKSEEIHISESSLKQEDEKEQHESVTLIVNENLDDDFDGFNVSRPYRIITWMANDCFKYPLNPNNLLLLDSSLLPFLSLNLQQKHVKTLLDDGMDPNQLDAKSFTPLENIFQSYDRNQKFQRIDEPESEEVLIRRDRAIVEIVKLLIRYGAEFYDKDLEDPNLLKQDLKIEEEHKQEEEDKLDSSDEDNFIHKNRYTRCFTIYLKSFRESKIRFWRNNVEELRAESQQAFKRYRQIIISSLAGGFPTTLSNLIAQYVHPGDC